MRQKIKNNSLYLIITEEYGRGRSALEIAGAAIAGGVDIIQMREKKKGEAELVELGVKLAELCKNRNVPFIVNDDPMLAKKVGADGVHLGQEDARRITASVARDILGDDKIIGLSTSCIEEIKKANSEDVDYIGFGPVFPTVLKEKCVGTTDVAKVLEISKKPVFFIGGINLTNIDELITIGARNIALMRGISEAEDVKAITEDFVKRIRGR